MSGSGATLGRRTNCELSAALRRAANRRYSTVALNSQVDESLFGPSHREVDAGTKCYFTSDKLQNDDLRRKKIQKSRIQLVSKDLIRNLLPRKDPSGRSLILRCADLERLQQSAQLVTEEQRKEAAEKQKQERDQLMKESQERRKKAQLQDRQRKKNERLTDLEEEERMKSEILQQKAMNQLLENEDEVKKLNELILEAKCHVIRDAQCLEKKTIAKEMDAEQKRLDHEMEIDRVNAIQIEEEIARKRKNERLIGAMMVMDQIKHNEQEKLLDLERKDHENKLMHQYLDQLCEEEIAQLDKRSQMKFQLRADLDECLEDGKRRKQQAKEEEKLLLEKVRQAQKEKAEREEAYENEQKRIKLEKEKETARLRAQQERVGDEQAARDLLRAKRAQEQTEREWRKKEELAAIKKANTEEMLKKARIKQKEEKEHFLAVQAQQDRADFERVLKAHQDVIEKNRLDIDGSRKRRQEFLAGIQRQIRDKEEKRLNAYRAKYEEGIKLDEEAKQRRVRLNEVKERKLNELRSMGIGDKYVQLIDHKIANFKL